MKRNDKDLSFQGYNLHYGWNKLLPKVLKILSTVKVKKANIHFNIEIILNATGNRMESIDHEIVDGEQMMIPPGFQQRYYSLESGYSWLITYITIRSKDSHLPDNLLKKYQKKYYTYEWLNIHMKGSKGLLNLALFFEHE